MTIIDTMTLLTVSFWLNSTGLITPVAMTSENMPEAYHLSRTEMVQIVPRCFSDPNNPDIEAAQERILSGANLGFFCHNILVVRNDQDLETNDGLQILLHELVHWTQYHNGDMNDAECSASTEYDAYMIQRHWQRTFELEQWPDDFTIWMRSTCL